MTKYAEVKGWAGNAGSEFHNWMDDVVLGYDSWNKDEVEYELFDQIADSLNKGESLGYEVAGQSTRSKNPETTSFSADEFVIEWIEVE